MFGKVYSITLHGIEGRIVQVETDISEGLPSFDMVGIPASEVKEAKERVRSAFRNSDISIPLKKVTINLAPADIRKTGTGFDLPIAISILTALGAFPDDMHDLITRQSIFLGELSLNGTVSSIRGILSAIICARENQYQYCFVPFANRQEASCIEGIHIIPVHTLRDIVQILKSPQELSSHIIPASIWNPAPSQTDCDFSDVNGQKAARRAIEIAVSGMHHLLLCGPPGSGKSMLARCIPSIMPPLTLEESIEITRIHSICGLLENDSGLLNKRPFRAPHHTVTTSSLAGGGMYPVPGEISLADRGVLFLDELPEFSPRALEILRQPMEDHQVNISRIQGRYQFPAHTMIAAAMNPCRCGYYPDRTRCQCRPFEVQRYLNRISGPLLDRIDISIEVLPLGSSELKPDKMRSNESSADIQKRVISAHKIQQKRFQNSPIFFNSQMTSSMVRDHCPLAPEAEQHLSQMLSAKRLSTRSYYKLLKTARTIADLEEETIISLAHIIEAECYRTGMEYLQK